VVQNGWQLPVRIRIFLLCHTHKHTHAHTHTFIIYMYICCLFDDALSNSGCKATKGRMAINERVWVGNEAETCGLKLTDVLKNAVKPRISLVCVFVVPTGIRNRYVPNTDGKRNNLIQYFRFYYWATITENAKFRGFFKYPYGKEWKQTHLGPRTQSIWVGLPVIPDQPPNILWSENHLAFQWCWNLISNYCTARRRLKCLVTLNACTTV